MIFDPMLLNVEAAVLLIIAAFLVVLAAVVSAWAALVWSRAISAAHQARAHGIQADAEQRTLDEANRAFESLEAHRPNPRADYIPPTEDEIREELIRQRRDEHEDREYTTLGNEGIEESEPIPGGGFYRETRS